MGRNSKWPGELGRPALETFYDARRPVRKCRPRHHGRRGWKSLGWHREPRPEFFQRTENLFPIKRPQNGLPGNDISCLYADKDGVLWVGTSGHGLARFQNGKWTRYSTDNGLASDSISYLLEDDAGYLWLGSNMGLMRIQKKSLNDFADGTTNSISCRTFTETDGLPTRECTAGSQPAAIRAQRWQIIFPDDQRIWCRSIRRNSNPTCSRRSS